MKEIIKMNTPKQNEFLVRWCLEHHETEKLQRLLKDGAQLSAFMLTCMVFFGYKDAEIKEIVLQAEYVSQDVFVWLKKCFKLSEIVEILEKFENDLPMDLLSEQDMIELKMWQLLAKRHKWDVIAQNAPEFLEQMSEKEEAMKALLNVNFGKYAPKALELGMYFPIISIKGGWKFLLEHGKKDFVLKIFKNGLDVLKSNAEVCQYIKEKGLADELYKNGAYDFLLENGIVEPFISHHSTWWRFLSNYPEQVQWESLWVYYRSDSGMRDYLINEAKAHADIPVCKEFVSRHTGIFSFLNR